MIHEEDSEKKLHVFELKVLIFSFLKRQIPAKSAMCAEKTDMMEMLLLLCEEALCLRESTKFGATCEENISTCYLTTCTYLFSSHPLRAWWTVCSVLPYHCSRAIAMTSERQLLLGLDELAPVLIGNNIAITTLF